MMDKLIELFKGVFATLPPKAIVAILGIAAEVIAPYIACKMSDPMGLYIAQIAIPVIVVAIFFVKFQPKPKE